MPRPGPVLSGSLLVNTKETDHMRKPGKFRLLASMFLALSLMAAACGDDDDTATDTGSDEATDTETDTETESDTEGGAGDGALAGMKGTTPPVDLDRSSRGRLLEVHPPLVDLTYGPETYTSYTMTALPAEPTDTAAQE